jgi:hypothetical protein
MDECWFPELPTEGERVWDFTGQSNSFYFLDSLKCVEFICHGNIILINIHKLLVHRAFFPLFLSKTYA